MIAHHDGLGDEIGGRLGLNLIQIGCLGVIPLRKKQPRWSQVAAAIAELVPNPERVTPPTAAAFGTMILATTPAGDAYTFELESISKNAGFANDQAIETDLRQRQLDPRRTGELWTEKWLLRGLHLAQIPSVYADTLYRFGEGVTKSASARPLP